MIDFILFQKISKILNKLTFFVIMNQMVLIIYLSIFLVSASANFELFKHSDNPSAKCLDGSPAALYFQLGTETDKFVIYFQGGGLCRGDGLANMLEYCYQRSLTNLGSSQNYPQSRSFDAVSFLSSDESKNPFHSWNKVFIPYCDGTLHVGSKLQPVDYKDKHLYFRGSNNTQAHFNFLNLYFNLFSATNITITGTSAGAVSAFLWSNYVYDRAENQEGVLIIPDSATMILDFPNIYNNKTMVDYTIQTYKIVLTQTKLPIKECIQKYPSQIQCVQSGNVAEFIKPRMYMLQSQYDSWGLIQILQFRCVPNVNPSNLTKCNDTQRAYIEKYRSKINEAMNNFTKFENCGIWSISCVQHGFLQNMNFMNSPNYKIPGATGDTIVSSLAKFIKRTDRIFNDPVSWPLNNGCSGLKGGQKGIEYALY